MLEVSYRSIASFWGIGRVRGAAFMLSEGQSFVTPSLRTWAARQDA